MKTWQQAEKAWYQEQEVGWSHGIQDHKAESEQEVGLGCKIL